MMGIIGAVILGLIVRERLGTKHYGIVDLSAFALRVLTSLSPSPNLSLSLSPSLSHSHVQSSAPCESNIKLLAT